MMLAAWRGQEAQAGELIEAISREATVRGVGRLVSLAAYASSVLYNGLGQHAGWAIWLMGEHALAPQAV